MKARQLLIITAGIASVLFIHQATAGLQSTETDKPMPQDTQATELTAEEQAELDAKRAEVEAAFDSSEGRTEERQLAEQEMQKAMDEHQQKIVREKHDKGQVVSEQELEQTEREALGSEYE
ncbi:hypothetical protein [Salinimonas lutimaris]|uniref:hypothetical protein n=1 Tax=Salinimonas lutimaris TaxID=914153 RepID=UPI0010BF74E5|nr:hypothetical protein [Salinimonas lutimaris]